MQAAQQALKTAAQAVPNGRPFDLEIDTRDGQRVVEVKVASDGNEFKILVDEPGERVISKIQESRPDDDVGRVEAAQVDAGRALQTAADREPNATVREVEIDDLSGAAVWKVKLVRTDGSEVQIVVDAQNGNIR